MKVRILGCGTSSGVPRIGNDWGDCDPAEPKNRRCRASILVSGGGTRILVDTGPDMRTQLLDADVATLSAVVWTHEHADHTNGLDDLRQLFHNSGAPVPAFASARTLASLVARFRYAFEGKSGYPATVDARELPDTLALGAISIRSVAQPHGNITSTGLVFEQGGKRVGYSTDFNGLTDDMATLYEGLDVWIVDALRPAPHPTHNHLGQTLAYIDRLKPERAILTHMDKSLDYATLLAQLPPHIQPGYDGMEIEP